MPPAGFHALERVISSCAARPVLFSWQAAMAVEISFISLITPPMAVIAPTALSVADCMPETCSEMEPVARAVCVGECFHLACHTTAKPLPASPARTPPIDSGVEGQ